MNNIHPTAIIGPNVSLGSGNTILPYTIINGPCNIGDNNVIGPHVVIGSPGEDSRNPHYNHSDKGVTIGSNNIIREFASVTKACYDQHTVLGDHIYMMRGALISHDAIVQKQVILSHQVTLAGHAVVLQGANLGVNAIVHQKSVIGHYAMVAMGAAVVKNIKPFAKYIPGKPLGCNTYALKKYGLEDATDEVLRYLLDGTLPQNSQILQWIEEFEHYHQISHRNLYQ